MTRFADLAVITNFSFLRGASHPEELVGQAYALGHAGIGRAYRFGGDACRISGCRRRGFHATVDP